LTAADVVVVGGGPAGAAAATGCASAGLDVVLVKASDRPSDRPGEALHPGVEPLLERLGVGEALAEAGFLRHPGLWVGWRGPDRFECFGGDDTGPWLGYQAPRRVFDAMLLARAEAAGARVWRGCRAMGAVLNDCRIGGVATSRGGIPAGTVIDASGRRHWLARQLGRPVARISPRLVVAYGHVLGSRPDLDQAPALRADERGWTWTARVERTVYAWVRLDVVRGPAWNAVPESLSGLVPRGRPRAADMTWRIATSPAGPGFFTCGDAGAVLDPSGSHGVLRALMSGMLAAEVTVEIAAGRQDERESAEAYGRWLTDWFCHDTARLHALYQVFPSWPRSL
jgi:flavin-dependent dehydrogenase